MASFDYCLNPLYPIKECSSCGALYTMDHCCSEGSLGDKIICDLDRTPDLSQLTPHNCPKCRNPVDGQYCQGCALLRKKFKEDLFTYCIENRILRDSSEPSNDNTNIVNTLQEPFVVKQNPVPIIPDPKTFNNQTVELPQTMPSFDPTFYSEDGNSFTYDSTSNLVHGSPNVFDPPPQPPLYSCEFCRNDARYGHYCTPQIPVCYDDDDDEDYTIAITPKDPDNSLTMGDEHLNTILATKSNEFIKSSVENLVPNPSESEGEHECDVPACEDFKTFSNILFDVDYDFSSSDDQSFYDEDILKEIYSNHLFDEEIISMKIDPHHFNIDSLFGEFVGELTLLKSIPPGINETDYDREEIRLIKRLLYDNSFPRPSEEFISKNSDIAFESFSPFPIPEDDYDSERDILILEELLNNDSLSLPKNESFHFDILSSSCPPAKPPDSNTGILNVEVMGDISKHKIPMPRLMPTLVSNQEKSPKLLPHMGHEAFEPSTECPMMFYGRNTPILDVSFLHFYPP
uniref:Pre-mRNA splicing Prp18-interacting factor n=1 Tax=Tanacetum cinerariifolium TaxID=118510 RepID=A0A699GN58_TANCI|nr:hypothetical protein [Tanacetum cinerariifolium]